MSTIIRTAYTSNSNGRSQILAKCNGKQRTVDVDLSKSADWNHGNAAGTVGLIAIQGTGARKVFAHLAKHMVEHDGRHRFIL